MNRFYPFAYDVNQRDNYKNTAIIIVSSVPRSNYVEQLPWVILILQYSPTEALIVSQTGSFIVPNVD